MPDISHEINEIDKLLEDLNQRLSKESQLKKELDEYIVNEITNQHDKLNESMQLKHSELNMLLIKHKQHLWNQIQFIKQIRKSVISYQEALSSNITGLQQELEKKCGNLSDRVETLKSDTELSFNTVKKEVSSEISKYYAKLLQKDEVINTKVDDLINKASNEHHKIIANLKAMITYKESIDSEISRLDYVTKSLDENITSLKDSIFATDGHLEGRLREILECSTDKDAFLKFVQKVDDDRKFKDRLIERFRKVSIAQSALIVLIIAITIARILLL